MTRKTTLRRLLIGQAVLCVLFGLVALEIRRNEQRTEALRSIRSSGGIVTHATLPGWPFQPEYWRTAIFGEGGRSVDRIDFGSYIDALIVRDIERLEHEASTGRPPPPPSPLPQGMRALAAFPELRDLCLSGAATTNDDLAVVQTLTALQRLDLAGTSISDEGLSGIERLTGLQYLNLSGTRISDDSLRVIGQMRSITTLVLGAWRHEDYSLPDNVSETSEDVIDLSVQTTFSGPTMVSSSGVAHLRGMRSLTRLHLRQTRVGDDCIDTLMALPELDWIDLRDTPVTGSAIERLRTNGGLNVVESVRDDAHPEGFIVLP